MNEQTGFGKEPIVARGSGGESSLHKHLRILDTFDALHPFRTLGEISSVSGLTRSTTHRLVAEMEKERLLERQPDRTYQVGLRMWEFASRTPGALGLRELARPWVNAVHSRVRQHTQLGVLSGTDVVFVERLSARDAVVNTTLIGGRIPAALSSSGIVLLGQASPELFDDVVAAGWPKMTRNTIPDAKSLRRIVSAAKSDGFAALDGHIYEGSCGVAVPVRGPHGVVYASLGVVIASVDAGELSPVVELLTAAASGLSRALEAAYLPHPHAGPRAVQRGVDPILSVSARSLEYFSELRGESVADALRNASPDGTKP